ncbi:MAG: cobalt-precorrin-5B (C(1))-methyltransferase [Devosiaceae bacterium]|nr:cobalt-precorrin-5B (C(1))-methyltransferase [Devosiaceae bacterium]
MDKTGEVKNIEAPALKRGWTTGACATAAAKSALNALLGKGFADPVAITLPGGQTPGFALAYEKAEKNFAEAGIIKDAGDDPDVTHGAMIIARISPGKKGSGIVFFAGEGVGTVTKAGLPIAPDEPAINPVPRQMIAKEMEKICSIEGCASDFNVTISVPGGEEIAKKTWNPRLGIIGGISILGTSGIVIPYSCSAWIHSIQSGIDVARAEGISHIVGVTGRNSEIGAQEFFDLPQQAYIDMGDFVGGMLKYLRRHPVKRISIAGGFAKISKLANGAMDLHSARSQVDIDWLCQMLDQSGADEKTITQALKANSANEILQISQRAKSISGKINLAAIIANKGAQNARKILQRDEIGVDIIIVDRDKKIIANSNGAN